MCVETCARVLGPCLLTLGLLSIVVNILLLFPNWEWDYLKLGLITQKAMIIPGVWGGGLLVFPAAVHITAIGWRRRCSFNSGTCQQMFISVILSALAWLGSSACFILSGVGLTEGPYCLYNFTQNATKMQQWGYPFLGKDKDSTNYLFEPTLWNSVCIQPQNVVSWNVYFFCALLIISLVEMVLAAFQIINAIFGCVCSFLEKN